MKAWILPLLYLMISACVDPIQYKVPPPDSQLVVDGFISDEPGPYTIKLSKTLAIDAYLYNVKPVTGATVVLNSDAGDHEVLLEVADGVYSTSTTQGVVGRAYKLEIIVNGKTYSSDAEKMPVAGEIQNVRFEFTANTKTDNGKTVNDDRFDILMDSKGAEGITNYLRWRMVGTYKIETFPQLHKIGTDNGTGKIVFISDPLPCSGPPPSECICCKCWITDYNTPSVSDDQLVSGSRFSNVLVGTVPVNRRTFYEKYYVEVEQMSVTPEAFLYWKLVRAQKDGVASLFQPPLANIKSNIHNTADANEVVRGFFWAGSVRRKSLFITQSDLPYRVAPIDTVTSSCLSLGGYITTTKPSFWK